MYKASAPPALAAATASGNFAASRTSKRSSSKPSLAAGGGVSGYSRRWFSFKDDNRQTLRLWQCLSKNIKYLPDEIAGNQRGDTSHVSARLGKACGKPQTDRIADEQHYNWYVRGCVLCSARSLSSDGNDEIGFRSHEVSGERRKLVEAINALTCVKGPLILPCGVPPRNKETALQDPLIWINRPVRQEGRS
jgi:hypothetical protein